MNEFIFDLQRFADYKITADSTTATTMSAGTHTFSVYAADATESASPLESYTITLTGSTDVYAVTDTDGNITIKLNVTSGKASALDFNPTKSKNTSYKYPPVILLGGTFNSGPKQKVTLGETGFTIDPITGSARGVDFTLTSSNKTTTVTLYDTKKLEFDFTLNNVKFALIEPSSEMTIKIDNDTKSFTVPINDSTVTVTYTETDETTSTSTVFKVTSGEIEFVGSDDTLSFSSWNKGDTFTATKNGVTTTYTMGTNSLFATSTSSSGVTKYWNHGTISESQVISLADLDFDTSDYLSSIFTAVDGVLDIADDLLNTLGSETSIAIAGGTKDEDGLYSISYGTFYKRTDDSGNTYYELQGLTEDTSSTDSGNKKFSQINVNITTPILFNDKIEGVPINVNVNDTTTSFISKASSDFSISSATDGLFIDGSNAISLTSGTLWTSVNAQTIAAGTSSIYSVSGYDTTGSADKDGITVGLSGSSVIVGDVDKGEVFTANGKNHTLLATGLLQETNGVYTLNRNYIGNDLSVTLGGAGESLITLGSTLEIGTKNKKGLVVNSLSNPTEVYASLTSVGASSYSLSASDDSSIFSSRAHTISLTGGTTTFDSIFGGANTTFASNNSRTTFIVTKSAKQFTISNVTATSPTITGATAITLTEGSLSVTGSSQTITVGGKDLVVTNSSGTTVSYSSSGTTISASAGDSFTFDGNTYTVGSSNTDGMTLVVDSSGGETITAGMGDTFKIGSDNYTVGSSNTDGMSVTIDSSGGETVSAGKGDIFIVGSNNYSVGSDNDSGMTVTIASGGTTIGANKDDTLKIGDDKYIVGTESDGITFGVGSAGSVTAISDLATEGDIFTYTDINNSSTNYSVTGAGFLRSTTTLPNLWKGDNSYSLTGGAVTTEDLNNSDNWLSLVIVDSLAPAITLSPNGSTEGIIISEDYSRTFGTMARGGTNTYNLTKTDQDKGKLSNIYLDSGNSSFTLNATGDIFLGTPTIEAQKATLVVNTATSNDSYQVTVDSSGNTGVVGAKKVTLVKGTLVADSSISDGVAVEEDETSYTIIPNRKPDDSDEDPQVTLKVVDSKATVSGLSWGEGLKINQNDYIFTKVGIRKGDQLQSGTKTLSKDENSLALADIVDNDGLVGMLPVADTNGLTIGSTEYNDIYLVDSYSGVVQPTKLYGELKSVAGGYSLTTLENSTSDDAWDKDNYTITINNTAVSLSSAFTESKIKTSQSNAEFTVDSLSSGRTYYIVKEAVNYNAVSITGARAITQTEGLINTADSGIQSVTIGDSGNVIFNSANTGLSVDISVSGGNAATLSAIDSGDNFSIKSGSDTTAYSKTDLGLMTDTLFMKDSASITSVTLSELNNRETNGEWIYIATIEDNVLAVPPSTADSTSEWLVLNSDKDTRYATLTRSGVIYSIEKDTNDWLKDQNAIQVGAGGTLKLSSDFNNVSIKGAASGAVFTVAEASEYTVTEAEESSTTGATISGGAKTITQTAGTIALSSSSQSIIAGKGTSTYSVSGNNADVTVIVSGSNVSVGALKSGDSFKIGTETYTLLSNGKIQRASDNYIFYGDDIATDDTGSIDVSLLTDEDATWYGSIDTDSDGNLTLNKNTLNTAFASNNSAFVINPSNATIFGILTKGSDGTFTLSRNGATDENATLTSITIANTATDIIQKLVFDSRDFANTTINAGSNTFTTTAAPKNGFTVNYDGETLSIDDATAVTLEKGVLTLNSTTQTVTANEQTIKASKISEISDGVAGAFTVTYDKDGVTVEGMQTATDSVTINKIIYTLTATSDDGFIVNINNDVTTVSGITQGDKFVIDKESFNYTAAGLTKTAANSEKIAFVLNAVDPANNELTLTDLQSTDESIWLGIYQVDKDSDTEAVTVTLSDDIIKSAVLVDDLESPTKNYGRVTRTEDDSGNVTYTLSKYAGQDGTLASDAEETAPNLILVGKDITATIDSEYFPDTIIKANEATGITVTNTSGSTYTVGGTIENFVALNMDFTPEIGDSFTINDGTSTTAYLMKQAGLTKSSSNEIWTNSGVTVYRLPRETSGTWSGIVNLTTAGVLDFTAEGVAAKDGSNIVVDSNTEERWATLTYDEANNSYTLKSSNSKEITSIILADGGATFTVNYATTITTGNGTYTINGKAYTGDELTIAADSNNSSTLKDGTVTIAAGVQSVTPTSDNAISTTSSSITATAKDGKWTTLGGLEDGDTFVINNVTYKVYGDSTLAILDANGDPEEIYESSISEDGTLVYDNVVDGDNYSSVVGLNSNNQLDLTKKASFSSAIVVGQESGEIDPKVRVAKVEYSSDDNAYTLSTVDNGKISTLEGVLLGTAVNTFNTALETTVTTASTGTFTINGGEFTAQNALTIETENGGAYLTNGKATLAEGKTINTRYTTTDSTVCNETITATNGILTIIADATNNTVTISDLGMGEGFTVGNTSYTMTAVGLTNGEKLNYDASKNSDITTSDLLNGDWKYIVAAPEGVLTLTNSAPSNSFIANVDTTNPTAAVKYGTLTKTNGVYVLTQPDDDDAGLVSVTLTGVKATFPASFSDTPITAKGVTFKATSTNGFTIDASSNTLGMSDVTAIELISGTMQASTTIPITVNNKAIKSFSGTMTVGIDDTGAFVGELNEGDSFTIDDTTTYTMTKVGLLNTTNQELCTNITSNTFYLSSDFNRIIAVEDDGSTLDLTNETEGALVYDSKDNPTKLLGELTVDNGTFTLNRNTSGIKTILLAEATKFVVSFESTVKSSGTTTVNGQTYVGASGSELIIDATADTSTLQSGTITLNSNYLSAKATTNGTLTVASGTTITATATDGNFVTISGLDAGDEFTFGGKTYTKTSLGLISSDNKLNSTVDTTVNISDLSNTSWQSILQITDKGSLTVNSSTSSDVLVVYITDDKLNCERYGTLTKSGGMYTLTLDTASGDTPLDNITINSGVKITLPTECADSDIVIGDLKFSVTSDSNFVIDATSTIPAISGATEINLTKGTLQAKDVPIVAGGKTVRATSGNITVGVDDTGAFVGALNEGDTFTIDGTTTYRMTATGLFDVTNQQLCTNITNNTFYLNSSFTQIIAVEDDGSTLDLTNVTEGAFVYDSKDNPTKLLGELTVDNGTFTLNRNTSGIKTILLAEATKFVVSFESTVKSSGTTTVNGQTYVGASGSELVIDATADTSTLQSGTITLNSNYLSAKATTNGTLTVASGTTITATATDGNFVTISGLDAGDEFTFGGKTYTKTSLGLISSDNKLNSAVDTTVNISDLSNTSWQSILQITDKGSLTVDSSTSSDVLVVYITDDKLNCARYGTLTKSGGMYTLTLDTTSGDTALDNITINSGVKITLPTECATATISVGDTTFSVKSDANFVIDTTSTTPIISGATEIDLTKGTLQAKNIPIVVSGKTVKATSGDITVGIDDTGAFVGALNEGDTFTVDDTTTYTMTKAGLLNTTSQELCTDITNNTFYLGSEFTQIIEMEADGSTLDLTDKKQSALIYDSKDNPTSLLGELTVTGSNLTLEEKTSGVIKTVQLAKDAYLTTTFATTVKASGTTTVSGQTYVGASDSELVIDATADTSTLQSGTITLNSLYSSAQATKDSTALAVENGTLTATAEGGKFTTLSDLNEGESFTFGGETYTQSSVGLIKNSDSTISDELSGETLNLSKLSTTTWNNFMAPSGGVLDLSSATANAIVFDNVNNPTTKLASLEISSSRIKLVGEDGATAIKTVTLPANSVLEVDFATKISAPTGSVTVNSESYNAASTVIIDSDGSTSTLYDGTVTLDSTNSTVTATNDTSTLNVVRGSITVTAFNGKFTTIGDLNNQESFNFNGTVYTKTAAGLMSDGLINPSLTSETVEISALTSSDWRDIIVPSSGEINLTSTTANAIICDSANNPSVNYATLTIANGKMTLQDNGTAADGIKYVYVATGTNLVVDFATQINAPSGTVTVNSKTYTGTTELVLDSDGKTSTLTGGTVSLANEESVTTTLGNKITAIEGDGITVRVDNDTTTINGLNLNDKFKVDSNTYKVTSSGLVDTSGKFWTGKTAYSDGLTIDALNLDSNWKTLIVVKDGAFSVDDTTLANGESSTLVDDLENPTKTFGRLTRDDSGNYTLKKDDTNTLSSINVSGVKVVIDNDLGELPITVISADETKTTLAITTSKRSNTFTIDATGDNAQVDNVNAIEISTGKIELVDGQTITLAEDAEEVTILAGNGTFNVGSETFTIAGLADGSTVTFDFDTDGEVNLVSGLEKDSTVTIDNTTYTAPEDKAILYYSDEDGWYFDDYAYDEYTVTVDYNGNVKVDTGVRFNHVISSGKTLAEDGTITLAADIEETPVKIINNGETALKIVDANGNTVAENLGRNKTATFNEDGVNADSLTNIAGATFYLQNEKTLTAGETTITADENNSEIDIGTRGNSININKSAQIIAPEDISLTLNAGYYEVNGVEFTADGTTSATTTENGVALDLAQSDPLAYDDMIFSDSGTLSLDADGGATVSGGAIVTNTEDKVLYVDGKAILDDKTINTAAATEITVTADGIEVGKRTLAVTGDDDGYTINISKNDIKGLENIGNSSGVTISGLYDATVKTDKAGSFTADGKTFTGSNDSITYGLNNGDIASVTGADTLTGDFSSYVTVNGDRIRIVSDSDAVPSVISDKNGVAKIEMNAAGTFQIKNKTYEIQGDTSFAFDMTDAKVSGVESLESGNLIISQKETAFNVNDDKITLASNSSPVTLGIVDSKIVSVSGVNGTISGLEDATVYSVTSSATVNKKLLDINNTEEFNVIVSDGVASSINGLMDGATINSAPNMTITTAENGTFTFVTDEYTLTDTLDGSFDFLTNANSRVTGINNFAGSISGGMLEGLTLNGETVTLSGNNITVETDGEKITNIGGLQDGSELNGDFTDTTLVIPEGEVTVNGATYKLEGDDEASLSGNGSIVSGVDRDATLTFGAAGTYEINGKTFNADAGDSFTVNRDGAYKIDPYSPPINEKTDSEDILSRSDNPIHIDEDTTTAQNVDLSEMEGDHLVLVDSKKNSPDTITAGAGNDSVVVRHGAEVDVNLNDEGETLIIPTAGKATLENYNGDNAAVKTYDYSNITNAIKTNEIKFGDGVMTLGDAVITFDPAASDTGSLAASIINAQGNEQPVIFTYTAGGNIDASDSNENFVMKGNYAENDDDTQKSGGSSIMGGLGNDTILAGGGDTVNGGDGSNQIYLTDKNIRNSVPEGATVILNDSGHDTVHSFASGFDSDDDKVVIKDFSKLVFDYGTSDLVMNSGDGRLTFDSTTGDNATAYELKLTDGTNDYNAAVAKSGTTMQVDNDSAADVFFGNENGISFSEYTGDLEVNLNEADGVLNGRSVQFYNTDKVEAGANSSTLIGAANTPNTLIAGTGNSSIWSNSGRDLMVGNTDEDKSGSATFFYMPSDGRDTIENFDFMSSSADVNADKVMFDENSGVTDVFLQGDDVLLGINNSADDYLTLADAKGKSFKVNDDLIAKVDTNVEFDGFTNCYVGYGTNATMSIGQDLGDVEIWLSDDSLEYHGIMYEGEFGVIDASNANGNNTLAGNGFDNLIIGGNGRNSIWGGYTSSNDTLVGGAGQNTFFFALENGHDVIQNAHDGDVVSFEDIYFDNIVRADISSNGVSIELTDGSTLNVQSNANIDYKLADGTTYNADHTSGQWNQK